MAVLSVKWRYSLTSRRALEQGRALPVPESPAAPRNHVFSLSTPSVLASRPSEHALPRFIARDSSAAFVRQLPAWEMLRGVARRPRPRCLPGRLLGERQPSESLRRGLARKQLPAVPRGSFRLTGLRQDLRGFPRASPASARRPPGGQSQLPRQGPQQ